MPEEANKVAEGLTTNDCFNAYFETYPDMELIAISPELEDEIPNHPKGPSEEDLKTIIKKIETIQTELGIIKGLINIQF